MSLLESLIIGSYIFTAAAVAAGARAFFYLYRLLSNHMNTRLSGLENRVERLERWQKTSDR